MQTIYEDRVIFCSDKSKCANCEFFFKCGAIPVSEFMRLCKSKNAALYGDSVGGPDNEKPIS